MYQDFMSCPQFTEYLKLYALPDIDVVNPIVSKELHLHNAITENTKIIDHNNFGIFTWNFYQAESVKRTSTTQMIPMTVLHFRFLN